MKFSLAVFTTLVSGASAFVAPSARARSHIATFSTASEVQAPTNGETAAPEPVAEPAEAAPVAVSESVEPAAERAMPELVLDEPEPAVAPVVTDPRDAIEPGRYNDISYSLTLPFLDRPAKLDGSHAGDFGFDPFGFTEENDLYYMQECELRHARLAMLAVVGWPASELVAPSWMLQDGRAPSVLNGVNPLSGITILAVLAGLGYFEYKTSLRRTTGTKLGDLHTKDMSKIWKYGVAGDYNFDPMNFYSILGDDAHGRRALREVEITQGRYAMLGITYFALWEFLTKDPIVHNNPLFHPNALVPAAAIGYFIWSQFYQISDVRKYPVTVEYTKDGEEMLRGIGRATEGFAEDMAPFVKAGQSAFETTKAFIEKQIPESE